MQLILQNAGKCLLKKHSKPLDSPISALIIGSWFQDRWSDVKIGTEKFRVFVDESYCRVIHNKDRLEQICAQKRAQEFYYTHLVHSKDEMNSLARSIHEQDLELYQHLLIFAQKNAKCLTKNGLAITGVVLAANAKDLRALSAAACACSVPLWELMDLIGEKSPALWNKYQAIQKNRGRLTQMDLDNRNASYARCIINNTSPNIYFAPEKDAPWYNGYYFVNMDRNRVEFTMGISKGF